jgi:hypothetical protein
MKRFDSGLTGPPTKPGICFASCSSEIIAQLSGVSRVQSVLTRHSAIDQLAVDLTRVDGLRHARAYSCLASTPALLSIA